MVRWEWITPITVDPSQLTNAVLFSEQVSSNMFYRYIPWLCPVSNGRYTIITV